MNRFIVNPPITDDRDYYRDDDDIVERIRCKEPVLGLGLRRSGKTSFLRKIQRACLSAQIPTLFFDLRDFYVEQDISKQVSKSVREIRKLRDAVVLLDEAEVFENADRDLLTKLLNACRQMTVVMTCAPAFVADLRNHSEYVQSFVERCYRHLLGPLNREEAVALLSRSKRDEPPLLDTAMIDQIWNDGDRLPIVLQALGAWHADGKHVNVSLAGLGISLLTGMSSIARETLVSAAHGGALPPHSPEVKLLTALGALRCAPSSGQVSIAGRTLEEIIRESTIPPSGGTVVTSNSSDEARKWNLHARILHISDLHFGSHCIDKPEHAAGRQLSRLAAVLEQDSIRPDFVAVTGDLSWSGHRSELKIAEEFLEGLVKWLGRSQTWKDEEARRRILLIPGNHDAAWSLTNGLKAKETEDWVCYSMAPFANFFNRFYRGEVFWDLERPCQYRCFSDPSLAVLSISTCHFITKRRKEGEFGNYIQDEVVRLLEESEVRDARFRVAMIHHNLRSFHAEGLVVKDVEGALMRFALCKPSLDLILHGHVHHGEVDAFKPRAGLNEIPYSSVGSFGVRMEHRPGDDVRGRLPNQFAILDLETEGTGRRFSTKFYEMRPTPVGGWEWEAGPKSKHRSL